MITKTKRLLKIEEGRTKLIVEHNLEDLTFIHPGYGPNTYVDIREVVGQDNLIKPTLSQTVSLIYTALNSKDKYSDEILSIMNKGEWLFGFTEILYLPNKGAYILDNPQRVNGMSSIPESDLTKKLESSDYNTRFTPFGYKTGSMTSLELSRNQFIRNLVTEEGAEKLAEIASNYRENPYLFAFDNVVVPVSRVSAVTLSWNLLRGLVVDGECLDRDKRGYGFGLSKNTS